MASFFSAPLRFFNSSHTHISSFEITFLERRNILFIGEPGISVSFPTSLFKPKVTETLLFLRPLIDKFAYRKVVCSRPVYYSILELFGQRSQYISIKFPLHKPYENLKMCY